MKAFSEELNWCGIDGACSKTLRVVVDAMGPGGAWFNPSDEEQLSPMDSVRFDRPGVDKRSTSAALDIVAHEWGHAVDKHGSANFLSMCSDGNDEACQMTEGFADVIGHAVEHVVQPNTGVGPERQDWWAGEDWDPDNDSGLLRSAEHFDAEHQCPNEGHYSVHVDDSACNPNPQDTTLSHLIGNRLAVVLRLMAEGGYSPAHGEISPCTGCDTYVENGIGVTAAAEILFRVLTIRADSSNTDWDDLPLLALFAAHDLYHDDYPPCAVDIQRTVRDAFQATGYPESGFFNYYVCGPQFPPFPSEDQ